MRNDLAFTRAGISIVGVPSGSYLRFPHIHRDLLTFVAEDDVWIAPLDGGRAWRLTVEQVGAAHPRLSPDGATVAWQGGRIPAEVHVAPVDGGGIEQLTHWGGSGARVHGWLDARTVIAGSSHDQPFAHWTWARTVPVDGGPGERLPYGPVSDLDLRDGHTLLLTASAGHDPAHWKRYRGGGMGRLWLDGQRLLAGHEGQLAAPMLVGGRIVFLSDHEGTGNLYSVRYDGGDLRKHTDHHDFYARQAATDGTRIVYARAGSLWLLPGLDAEPEPLEVRLGGAGRGRQPFWASPGPEDAACDTTGRASAVEVGGAVHWVTHEDGPVRLLSGRGRARLPIVLGRFERADDAEPDDLGRRVNGPAAWVTDAAGEDAIELGVPGRPTRTIAAGELGQVEEMEAAPDGSVIAVASHDGRLLLVGPETGAVTELTRTEHGVISDLGFDPRSQWLVWCHPVSRGHAIRMARLQRPGAPDDDAGSGAEVTETPAPETPATEIVHVTDGRFTDMSPAFTGDGRNLVFLSLRGFEMIRDSHSFDLVITHGTRPYLVPLAAGAPSPFAPSVEGRPADGGESGDGPVTVDLAGLDGRIVPLPVPDAHYWALRPVKGGLVWCRGGSGEPTVLERFDLDKRKTEELATDVHFFSVSGDGSRIVVRDAAELRVISATGKNGDGVTVDLDRVRVRIDPGRRWRQAYAEAGRIMRDHFWVGDMAGVDWPEVLETYRPWLDRIGGPEDFADLVSEVVGELGASHAYVYAARHHWRSPTGRLGADIGPDTDGLWRVRRIYPSELSDSAARSPLQGSGVRAGDAILAVDGVPVDPVTGPAPLLWAAYGHPVELTVESGPRVFRVAVVPLVNDRRLRYHSWVADRRRLVRRLSGGRIGYLHVPDMQREGWAQLHRDLSHELAKDAVIVDVRANQGGNTSQLVVEKLSRRIVGWKLSRREEPRSYPADAPRGPVVVLCDEETSSDGDIITAAVQALGLGPVIGTRTWGGVIGIRGVYRLADGTRMRVPGFAHWSENYGWELENRGATPDEEVLITPADWARGADPQLDAGVRHALRAMEGRPVSVPPDPATRPFRGRVRG